MCTAPNCGPHYSLWLIELCVCVCFSTRARADVRVSKYIAHKLKMIAIFSICTKNIHRSSSKIIVGFFLALVRFFIFYSVSCYVCMCVCACVCLWCLWCWSIWHYINLLQEYIVYGLSRAIYYYIRAYNVYIIKLTAWTIESWICECYCIETSIKYGSNRLRRNTATLRTSRSNSADRTSMLVLLKNPNRLFWSFHTDYCHTEAIRVFLLHIFNIPQHNCGCSCFH